MKQRIHWISRSSLEMEWTKQMKHLEKELQLAQIFFCNLQLHTFGFRILCKLSRFFHTYFDPMFNKQLYRQGSVFFYFTELLINFYLLVVDWSTSRKPVKCACYT